MIFLTVLSVLLTIFASQICCVLHTASNQLHQQIILKRHNRGIAPSHSLKVETAGPKSIAFGQSNSPKHQPNLHVLRASAQEGIQPVDERSSSQKDAECHMKKASSFLFSYSAQMHLLLSTYPLNPKGRMGYAYKVGGTLQVAFATSVLKKYCLDAMHSRDRDPDPATVDDRGAPIQLNLEQEKVWHNLMAMYAYVNEKEPSLALKKFFRMIARGQEVSATKKSPLSDEHILMWMLNLSDNEMEKGIPNAHEKVHQMFGMDDPLHHFLDAQQKQGTH